MKAKLPKTPKITADARRHKVDEMVAKLKNPMQPIYEDEMGRTRFKPNAIVRKLLDQAPHPPEPGPYKKPLSLNDLVHFEFSQTDWIQFYQLIGYSLDGYSELSRVANTEVEVAEAAWEAGVDPRDARIEILETQLHSLRLALREPMAQLFDIHPDDLGPDSNDAHKRNRQMDTAIKELIAADVECDEANAAIAGKSSSYEPTREEEARIEQANCRREAALSAVLRSYPDYYTRLRLTSEQAPKVKEIVLTTQHFGVPLEVAQLTNGNYTMCHDKKVRHQDLTANELIKALEPYIYKY